MASCNYSSNGKGYLGIVQALDHTAKYGRAGSGIRQYLRQRISSLSLSRRVSLDTSQVGGIRWMDLDAVEQRYLLTAAADSTVEAFDVLVANAGTGHQQAQVPCLFSIKRSHPAAHRFQVTCLTWYPVDTGLFVTGSADQDVKVWDTNMLEVACVFNCPDKVMAVAMSSCASSHALIAVGTKKPMVILADVVSGAFTHTLVGHSCGVWSTCWSPANEHHLFTGDASGEVRLWDVRRSGTRALLDMAATQKPKPKQQQQPFASAAANAQPRSNSGSLAGLGLKRKAHSLTSSAAVNNSQPFSRAATDPSVLYNRGSSNPDDDLHYEDPTYGVRITGRAIKPLAHEGPVTCIHTTADGLNLLTAGCDNRLRLWDAHYLHHKVVHYSDAFNSGAFPKRMSSTPDGRHLFAPRGNDIQVFDIGTGQQLALLSQGHYSTITACVYSPNTSQLWSTGLDGMVVAWEPWREPEDSTEQQLEQSGTDRDWWMAAASGRRAQLPTTGSTTGSTAATVGAAGRRIAADVDAWSEEEDAL